MYSVAQHIGNTILTEIKLEKTMNMNTDGKESNVGKQVVSYLSNLNGRSIGYIQQLAEHITVELGTEQIRNKVFRMWMIMACATADHVERIRFEKVVPKFDSMMIFVGSQGIGKTRFFRAMLPEPLRKYFVDGLSIDPIDKDSIAECIIGHWVIEVSGIDGIFKKTDISRFKAFLGKSIDILRRPYESTARKYERRTVFVAATNERKFLKDYTENRQYWPLAVEKLTMPNIDLVNQAWAEAWKAYIDGEQWWPQTDLEKELSSRVTSFQVPRKVHF